MKIIIAKGGIGNQIFQYLFFLHLKQNNQHVHFVLDKRIVNDHNGWEMERWFQIPSVQPSLLLDSFVFILKCLCKLKVIKKVEDSTFKENGLFYDGYWQDKQFFMDQYKSLKIKNLKLNRQNLHCVNSICNTNSVSIHIRRGDYINEKFAPIYGSICTKDYYTKAIDIIEKKVNHPHYFIFSDDIDWVKANLSIDNADYVDWNKGSDSFYDLFLMSKCKHHIIANSSFSFWGCMLANHENQINIYPSKWYNSKFEAPNIFPNSWIGI